eukprot:scaffold6009_cov214-Chaetoceros_neogracile.AAC.1
MMWIFILIFDWSRWMHWVLNVRSKGMGQEVADKIHHVHFEKADLFLKAHNCEDLLQRFHGFWFDIYRDQQTLVHPSNYNQPMPYDLDAKRPDKV